jgi:hypothetical protein
VDSKDLHDWVYDWSASRGVIEDSGAVATYTAPDEPGWVVISVEAWDGADKVFEKSTPIMVFKQFVILKADDYESWDGTIHDNWRYYLDYLVNEKHVKNSVGVIAACLDPQYTTVGPFIDDTAAYSSKGMVEYWCHGLFHDYDTAHYPPQWTEFFNTPYEFQRDRLQRSQQLAYGYLGDFFHTFGASFDEYDDATVRAINESNKFETWFGGPKATNKTQIGAIGYFLENPTGLPNYALFLLHWIQPSNFQNNYTVLQTHPNYQTFRDNFDQFRQVIDYLISEKATFITPVEYSRLMTQHVWPLDPYADADNDGMSDFKEGREDMDQDGLPNFLDGDSDGDSVGDAAEIAFGTDPYDASGPTNLPLGSCPSCFALILIGAFLFSRRRFA